MATTRVQEAFRLRNDDGSETTATWIDAANTSITPDVHAGGYSCRIRVGVTQTGTTSATLTGRLYVAKNGGSYAQISGTSAGGIRVVGSANITDNENTTQQITSGTFVVGRMDDVNGQTTATSTMAQNTHTEYEFMVNIVHADVTDGDYFDFRVRNSTTVLTTYTVTPRITVNKIPAKYWVAGAGDWDDTAHWADVSGGVTTALMDSYYDATANGEASLSISTATNALGQTFTGDGGTLHSCSFYLDKFSSPTGTLTVSVYAHTGTWGSSGMPTGSALATSGSIAASSLSTSYTLTTFPFTGANKITLTNGTHYVLVIHYSTTDAAGPMVNSRTDGATPTASGNFLSRYNTDEWSTYASIDMLFYVYKDAAPGGAVVPAATDDVFIDANSGFGSGGTINLVDGATCNDFTSQSGHTYTVESNIGEEYYSLTAFGSLYLEPSVTLCALYYVGMESSASEVLTQDGATLGAVIIRNGSCTLQDNLAAVELIVIDASFDANGFDITLRNFRGDYQNSDVYINMGSGTWTVKNWQTGFDD